MSGNRINTRYIKVDQAHPEADAIAEAGLILRGGGLVAFPTETVYGLGADATNGLAVARIFEAKGRPPDNPIIVHVAFRSQLNALAASISAAAEILMDAFWPGPLTIILPAGTGVPEAVTAGLTTVAVRMPDHPVALALIKAAGVPVAAPSANLSGKPSPTRAEHVVQDLDGRIDAILDGGPAGVGVESTVLDLTSQVPIILRPGGITPEELRACLGRVEVDRDAISGYCDGESPRSPGMKYTHYAPRAPLLLVTGSQPAVASKILEMARVEAGGGRRAGILTYSDSSDYSTVGEVVVAGRRDKPETVAAGLYSALRRFNEMGVDIIFAEGLEEKGVGLAVMNRLKKAAGGRIIKV
ncbi:L-threonylcarbamoyladenylate synthase [Pelotomaculum propionicicum]|uniref:L-threonylcarbamoyladenylate synthase n=1 Tax=Pelotomaculum propionicicum TaxID=258475 RepID=UPI003B8074AC